MGRFVLRRAWSGIIVLLVGSIAVFGVLHLAPGDPAALAAGPDASPAAVHAVRAQLGLDRSIPHQYLTWLHGVLTGDLGTSYAQNASIARLIGNGAGNTLELTLAAVVLAALLGGAIGIAVGTSRHRSTRTVLSGLIGLVFAVPTYVSGVLFVLLFAVTLRVLPAGGHAALLSDPAEGLKYLLMPSVALALPSAAVVARFLSTSIRQVMEEDYIQTVTAKGLAPRRIILRHALPNALPPVLTVFAIQIGHMLGGAIVVEQIFAWPGLGQLLINSVKANDYLIVQDLLLMTITVFVVLQTLTDLLQARVDPRVKLGRS
jgi:peptide/nickel transport system permease protein